MRVVRLIAFVSLIAPLCVGLLASTAAAKAAPSLSQGCLYAGKADAAAAKGKNTNDANKADAIFTASPDPQAQAAENATTQFAKSAVSDPSLLSQPDPITVYCQTHYPAAYFKGSRVASAGCTQQVAAWVALGSNASNAQENAAELAMLTACGSRAEWLQAAAKGIPQGDSSFGKPAAIYKAFCDPNEVGGAGPANAAAPGCRNK
jgi:hypothetical protein